MQPSPRYVVLMIRVGLIGYGLAGASFHAPLIGVVAGLRLTHVVTSRGEAVARDWPGVQVLADADALLGHADVDLVVIATPDHLHAPLARQALAAGKHVVIDKPFVTDPADGAALIALAEARGLMLSAFHNRRWDADFLTVQQVLTGGDLGDIALAELRWDRFRPAIKLGWRETQGAGLLNDLGPHLLDQALQLFGTPEAVSADLATQRAGAATEDYFEVTLFYGSCRVIVSAATLLAQPRPRFALYGTGGSFVKYGIDPQEAVLRAGQPPSTPEFGKEAPEAYGVLTKADGSARTVPGVRGDWREYYAGVVAAITGGAPAPVPAREAQAVMELVALARRSAAEGRRLPLA
ncbi:oxidoreductase [Sphingomonas sp. MMS24-J45]|uniref:oxidoreductase n=1 Tax=Sphingomonas sp. MMS24-J45 TaxID=3238806 RepID=UPI0038518081